MVTINAGGIALLGGFSGNGSFTDPDGAGDTYTATVNYGDKTPTVPLKLTRTQFVLSHTYGILGPPYTITVTVTDSEGLSGSGTTTVVLL